MTLNTYSHKNIGISVIRTFSTIFIVVCHILQAYGNVLAFYFNIGVPLFLGISGWLYGCSEKREILSFYRGRFNKVIIPYYLFCLFLFGIYVINKVSFTTKQVVSMLLCQQAFGPTLPFCGHLWFITIISVCYIITPLLMDIRNSLYAMKGYYYFIVIFCAITILVAGISFLDRFPIYVIYITVYILGFFVSAIKKFNDLLEIKRVRFNGGGSFLLFIGLIGFLILYFLQSKGINFPSILLHFYKIILSVIIIANITSWDFKYFTEAFQPLLNFFERYSYSIYLCHHIWILGVLSVVFFSYNYYFNIILAFLLVLFSAIVFQFCLDF